MRSNTKFLPTGLLALGLLAAACGEVITPDYRGQPIATVGGQLMAAETTALPETVRLAVAWYPSWLQEGVASAPKAIVTQEVAYRGTFPQRFTFDFFAPPPDAALVDAPPEEGIAAKAAYGLLLAYEDLNGNGKLDTLSANGTGGDRILGSAFDWNLDTPATGPTGYALFYAETGPENDAVLAAQGLRRGYNLIGTQSAAPLDTPISIALTAKPWLGMHICEELYTGDADVEAPCGIVFPDPNDPDPLPSIRFGGSVSIINGVARIEAQLFTEEGTQITDATVFVDETPVSYDDEMQQYILADAGIEPGDTVELVAKLQGGGERKTTITMPGAFTLEAPTDGAHATAGASLVARWTASTGASAYGVQLETGDFASSYSTLVTGVLSESIALDASWTGNATVTVTAEKFPGTDLPEGFLLRVGHRVGVTIDR